MLSKLRQSYQSLLEAIEEVERESLMEQVAHPSGSLDGRVIGITLICCVVLTFLEFYGSSSNWRIIATVAGWFGEAPRAWVESFFSASDYGRLSRLGYWAISTSVGYMIVPMLYIKYVLREPLVDWGLSPRGTLRHAWIYVVLYLLVLPMVYLFSGTDSFQHTYPFYGNAGRSVFDFIVWELLYALQFLSLEFFFRGFLVHGLKRRFGFYAIFVAVIPYCMIHFGKPFPEAIGSIFAGLTLGAFSLFTGNIWLGVMIHVSVAISMDVFALWAA